MTTIWLWRGFLSRLVFSLVFALAAVASAGGGVPLPNRNVTLDKGLSAGMGFGTQYNSACKNLITWSGYGNYSYKPSLVGGASAKFSGGNLDSTNRIVYQRYSVNAMFLKSRPTFAMFLGPVFSFENTDLQALMDEIHHIGISDENKSDTKCREYFSEIGSSVGYQSGVGYLINKDWGVAFGHSLDMTFMGNYLVSFSGSIALNLRNQFEKLSENTQNAWLSFEYANTATRVAFNIHNVLLGLALSF